MDRRFELHSLLMNLLKSSNVYFQPPASVNMKYPCILYSWDKVNSKYADDVSYSSRKGYQITVIDRNPDSLIPDKVGQLALASFDRHFVADNMHHFVYTLYF